MVSLSSSSWWWYLVHQHPQCTPLPHPPTHSASHHIIALAIPRCPREDPSRIPSKLTRRSRLTFNFPWNVLTSPLSLAKIRYQTLREFAPEAETGIRPFFLAFGLRRPHLPFYFPEQVCGSFWLWEWFSFLWGLGKWFWWFSSVFGPLPRDPRWWP